MRETMFQIVNALMFVWALTIWPIALWSLFNYPRWSAKTYLIVATPAVWWISWL